MTIVISIVLVSAALHLYQQSRPVFNRRYGIDSNRIRYANQANGSTPRVISCYTPLKSNGKGYTFNEAMKGVKSTKLNLQKLAV